VERNFLKNQEVFKKYTGIFAISSKGIGYEVYKKGVLIVIEW
jgi:hypothetical protein